MGSEEAEVIDGEDCGVEADAEGQGVNGGESEGAGLGEEAARVAQTLREGFHPLV